MTSYASLRSAVDSMRMGAVDYIAKPFDHDEMLSTVTKILLEQTDNNQNNNQNNTQQAPNSGMLGNSEIMQTLYKRIATVAPTDATILISGETGTGKELAARAIHESSARNNSPIISINCAAIPETLIESELFGHEKGAFTGASSSREGLIVAADGGTLFLDEIGELPMEAQARLLRVLQEGEVRPVGSIKTHKVNIRLIAATHRDLAKRCQKGTFREDLYFRLNVIQLQLPPLRDRGKDIITLAETLTQRFRNIYNKPQLCLSEKTIQIINTYPWPGNVRELENAIQRAVILCEHPKEISHELLSLDVDIDNDWIQTEKLNPSTHHNDIQPNTEVDDLSLMDYFRHLVLENQDTMNETELAKKLGISRKCLWERRQKLGIPRKKTTD